MEESDRTPSSTTDVTYGGAVIAKLVAGQTATLECARKRMRSDVIIKAGSGSGGGNSSVVTDGSSILIKSATVTREGDDTLTIS
jgi:hypothetical protein